MKTKHFNLEGYNPLGYYFKTPLEYAIELRNFKAIQLLTANYTVINYQNLNNLMEMSKHNPYSYATSILMSILYGAIAAKRMDLIELLLTNIPKQAIVHNSPALLKIFCAQPRFSTNFSNHTKSNYFKLEKIIKLLLDNGLDLTSVETNTGSNILHIFSEFGISGEDYKLSNQIDINKTDHFGQTPLIKAAEMSNFRIIEYLIKQGVDVKLKDLGDNTALHFIVANRAYQPRLAAKIITLLLNKGADPHDKNIESLTPVDYLLKDQFSRECFLAFYMHGIKFDFKNEKLRCKLAKKIKYFKIKASNKIELVERLLFKLVFLKEFSEEEQPEDVQAAKINIINELTIELTKSLDKLPNTKKDLRKLPTMNLEHMGLLNPLQNINNVSGVIKELYKQILKENMDKFSDPIKELYNKLLSFIDEISPKVKNSLKKIEKSATDSLNHELQQDDNVINFENRLTQLSPFGEPIANLISFFKGEDIENLLLAIKNPPKLEKSKQCIEKSNKRIKLSENININYPKAICIGEYWGYAEPSSEISELTNTSNTPNLEILGSNKYFIY
ncbi:hypothetical protein phytr_5590 [Candidatus Phycorickettsia trachydisci]|uniref:Uncharacterized protein n=1 Tax=Candidatus Phycorickettsia trachydisci TaxID=2115978 RepID=A0A2P1P8A8_9RICK|nr:ankyrin repeat domain-containing protein [Candidatus Phycorickettsia trachydisci]AVP87503.1 hypothetical protein phytr_5590 [Candidatus Phycorickettsia trachydisci]